MTRFIKPKVGRWLTLLALGTSLGLTPAQADRFPSWWSWWRSHNDIVSRLEADGRFGTLLTALEVAGLTDTLATGGPFTLLAPTDDAFAAVPAETLEALLADKDALTQVLLYHVIAGKNYSYQLLRNSTAVTLEGNPVLIVMEGHGVMVNGQRVNQSNIWASNGVIHALDGVLLPPAEPLSIDSLVDVLKLDGRFGTLLAAVDAAGLGDALADGSALTLFAPTDDAFAALPEGTVESLLEEPEGLLTSILLYHVVGESLNSQQLYRAGGATTLQGDAVSVGYRNWKLYVNDSQVINANVKAPNGYIHVIDAVLLPPEKASSIVDLLVNDGRFGTLVAAVQAAGLADVLANGGPFTVLAPTDKAFAALPEGTLDSLLADPTGLLKDILLYHVLDGDRSLADLKAARRVATLEGNSVRIWSWPWYNLTYVNRSRVIDSDLGAENGRVQVIDRVLLPPSAR